MHLWICSDGFAVTNSDDNETNEDGKARVIACGTEKGKHKCKNQKSAGAVTSVKIYFWVYKLQEVTLSGHLIGIEIVNIVKDYVFYIGFFRTLRIFKTSILLK